ncbi:MAG TPA: hydroxyisourate hydrolase [Candidatus Dormibacteraeota bacterium]|nr:hydroxyisourate hydrolase [Candidatus Dormibacteraeota bacterium]
MPLSTHVLDIARGVPATELKVSLYRIASGSAAFVAASVTDADGRIAAPFGGELDAGIYELLFAAGAYFTHHGISSFLTDVPVRFRIGEVSERCHVPLLLSPFGYSTYRGT